MMDNISPQCQYIPRLSTLRVEPFLFLYMCGYSLSAMAVSQLVQDKLCRVNYEQPPSFCLSINSADFDHAAETIKSNIIKDSTYITLYRTILSTLPCMIWVLFLGPWTDNYINGRKYIMIVGAIASALESLILLINSWNFFSSAYYVLLSFIPSAVSGGIISTLMSVYAYSSATSTTLTRSFRFAIVEICFWIAQPIGLYIGGQILGNGDLSTNYQLYNYIPVFAVSFCTQIAAIIWAILVIDENKSLSMDTMNQRIIQVSIVPDISSSNENLLSSDVSFASLDGIKNKCAQLWVLVRNIFILKNVKELFQTFSKKRMYLGRGQIWALFISTFFLLLVYLNTTFVLWSYIEKLYSWKPKYYSNVTSGAAISTILFMGFIYLIFVLWLRFTDIQLSLIGVISLMVQCILRGSWQHELGLFLSLFLGTLSPLSFIGIRSRLSKIINENELGKLFAMLAIIEAMTPGIASVFYSMIFASSIDIYPGLVFQIAAFILLIPLLIIIFVDIYCPHNYDSELE